MILQVEKNWENVVSNGGYYVKCIRPHLMTLLILLLVSFAGFCSKSANAQQSIELTGFKWPRNYIGVYVASGVSDTQRKQVLFALNVWYSA
jgi:hypothetical protein